MPQTTDTNAYNLRAWLLGCPRLNANTRFRVDFLSDASTEYALYSTPSTLRTRENILGQVVLRDIQTQNYIFASREAYGSDAKQNLENLSFYDDVVSWIIDQNSNGNFPARDDGTILAIVPTLTAYVAQAGSDAAKYQIQIQVTYRRS